MDDETDQKVASWIEGWMDKQMNGRMYGQTVRWSRARPLAEDEEKGSQAAAAAARQQAALWLPATAWLKWDGLAWDSSRDLPAEEREEEATQLC